MSTTRCLFLAAALLASPLLSAGPAEAQVGATFGFGFGGPAYPAYPALPPYPYAYYPPPGYYAPPYASYAEPYAAYPAPAPGFSPAPAAGAVRACYAGTLTCPPDRNLTAGDACACPAPNGRRAWGRVGG